MSSRSSAVPRPLRARCDSGSTVASPTRSTRASSRMLSPVATPSFTQVRGHARSSPEPGACRAGGRPGGRPNGRLPELDGRSRLEPRSGTDEATPLPRRQPVPYNRWKAKGERALRSACRETGTRLRFSGPDSRGPSSRGAHLSSPTAAASATRSTSTTSSMRSTLRSNERRRRTKRSSSPTTTPSPGACSTSRSAGRLGTPGARSPTSCPARRDGRRPSACSSSRRIRPRASSSTGFRGRCATRFDAWPSFRLPSLAGPAKADARDVDPADLRLQVPDHKGAPHARLRAAGRVRRGVPQDRRLARLRRLSARRCGTELCPMTHLSSRP